MRKRLVYRADDIGYTSVFDKGAYRAFEEGIATSADVMLDSPDAVNALHYFAERPWYSVGWHRHLWESPLLPKEEIPSLVDQDGRFKWRHQFNEYRAQATYEDAYREFMAEAELCRTNLGRYPDSASGYGDIPLEQAFKDVCLKLAIPFNFWTDSDAHREDPKYSYLKFKQWGWEDFGKNRGTFKPDGFVTYDPFKRNTAVEWTDDTIWRIGGHPGYLDDHVLSESSCHVHRVKDLTACLQMKQWVLDNQIELINQKDVLYGTNELQNHYKEINSPLWIGNMKREN